MAPKLFDRRRIQELSYHDTPHNERFTVAELDSVLITLCVMIFLSRNERRTLIRGALLGGERRRNRNWGGRCDNWSARWGIRRHAGRRRGHIGGGGAGSWSYDDGWGGHRGQTDRTRDIHVGGHRLLQGRHRSTHTDRAEWLVRVGRRPGLDEQSFVGVPLPLERSPPDSLPGGRR